jgi:hypothetical protein
MATFVKKISCTLKVYSFLCYIIFTASGVLEYVEGVSQ